MKITYTAPNRSHHYPFAKALNDAGVLHAFISGFSRFSPRSSLPEIGDRLKRRDVIQNIYLLSSRLKLGYRMTDFFNGISHRFLDISSRQWALESDVFIYYRTEGLQTSNYIHQHDISTVCVMEEVNTHVIECTALLNGEYERLGFRKKNKWFADFDDRMKGYEISDFILCPSEFVKKSFLKHGMASEKLIKIKWGFPELDIQDERYNDNDVFRLLYVGQIHFRKGLHYAIEAFKKLNHPKKEFIIVGPQTSTTGLERTKIPSGVIFKGVLKGEALKNEYRRASVFILPTIEEGLALVQGEALSFGIPLITTTNSGGDDLISSGDEGFIVEPSNSSALAEKLQLLADDVHLKQEMSFRAYQAAKRLGSWENTIEDLLIKLCENMGAE